MVNREKFMLDVDSEGYPLVDTTPFHNVLAATNNGKVPSVFMAQALLADTKCVGCPPSEDDVPVPNPEGWQEVAVNLEGEPERTVKLPPINWAVQARELVCAADLQMDGSVRLSDSVFPDAYYGWKL